MATIDDIFKSDLNENKKKSKMIFGRLLLQLKKNSYLRLYSLMSDVADTDFDNNILTLIVSTKSTYDTFNSHEDTETINKMIKCIDNAYVASFKLEEKVVFDSYKFKERLKKEFGKILTIKSDNK